MIKPYFLLLLLFTILVGCGKTERVDTKAVKEALRNREIKRISEAEILEAGLKRGRLDAKRIIKCYNRNSNLVFNYRECFEKSQDKLFDTVIVVAENEDTLNLTEIQKQLYNAYQYQFSQNQPLEPNLQKEGTQYLTFTLPVFFKMNDKKIEEKGIENDRTTSFGIIIVKYDKKQLILEL